MYDTKIQTPISSKVLRKAKTKASEAGFSSINDVIRMIVNQFAEGKIQFGFTLRKDITQVDFVDEKEQKDIERILRKIKTDQLNSVSSTEIIKL